MVEVPLPAFFAAQKGLNEPRYPSMKGIMKAKKKPMDKKTAADIGMENITNKVSVISYALPKPREAGKVLEGEPGETAPELAKLLRAEAKII